MHSKSSFLIKGIFIDVNISKNNKNTLKICDKIFSSISLGSPAFSKIKKGILIICAGMKIIQLIGLRTLKILSLYLIFAVSTAKTTQSII
jgi:predicted aspartyl protease